MTQSEEAALVSQYPDLTSERDKRRGDNWNKYQKGNMHFWSHAEGWTAAELIEGSFKNHRYFSSLRGALLQILGEPTPAPAPVNDMTISLEASDWSLLANEIENDALADRARSAADGAESWSDEVAVALNGPAEVAEFHRAYLKEFAEEYQH